MNLPNLITCSRLLLTAVCFLLLELVRDPAHPDPALCWWAFGLFAVASSTDFVDGYLARARGQVTTFGRIVDPFADKVLVCGVLVILMKFPAALAIVDTWVVVIILAREFLVTTIRGLAESSGIPFPAERLGKYKMVVQCLMAGSVITVVAGSNIFYWVAAIGVWVTLALSVASAAQYVYRARRLLTAAV